MEPEYATPPQVRESDRLLAVYRRWRRAQRLRSFWAWHRFSQLTDMTMGFLSVATAVLIPLDGAIWRYLDISFSWSILAPRSGTAVSLLFFCVCAFNGVLLHLYISRNTPDEKKWPRWLRILRALFGGFPVAGLCVVPLWRRFWESRSDPIRASEELNTESDLDGVSSRHVALSKHWMDLVGSQWLLPWLFLSGTAVFLVAACWLAGRAAHSPGAHRLLIAASSSLHLVAFTVFLLHARREASRLRLSRRASIALIAISALWLLPLPYFFLAFLLYFPMSLKPSNTLISEALIREKVAGRSPLWLRFEDRLRVLWPEISPLWRWWSPPRPVDREVERSQEEDRILRLYNLESYSLGFDAAALAWALVWISEHQPVWSQGLGWIHCTVLTISFLLFAVGFCAAAVHIVLLFLRSPGRLRMLDRYPYANYLAKTQFCCFLGWISGLTLRTYGARQIAGILISFSMLLVLLKCYYHLLMLLVPQVRSRQRPLDALIGIALLVLLPTLVAISPAWGSLTATLALWAVLYPVRAFLLGRFLVPWLLRPFAWEDLFASGIPIRLRVLLASLAAPAVLPLGGLAAPLQIFARHKLWPRAEAFWREREKHELP